MHATFYCFFTEIRRDNQLFEVTGSLRLVPPQVFEE